MCAVRTKRVDAFVMECAVSKRSEPYVALLKLRPQSAFAKTPKIYGSCGPCACRKNQDQDRIKSRVGNPYDQPEAEKTDRAQGGAVRFQRGGLATALCSQNSRFPLFLAFMFFDQRRTRRKNRGKRQE